MKTIIAGSRTIKDYSIVKTAVRNAIHEGFEFPTCIVSGGANGVDKLGEKFADQFEISKEIYQAEWDKYGRSAGYIRNEKMAKNAEALIAIWDGRSRGTRHMIDLAKKYNLRIYVHKIED